MTVHAAPQATAGSRSTIPRSPSPKTVTPVSYPHRRQGPGVLPGSDKARSVNQNGRLLDGLLLRIVGGPCVRYGETDDLAREAADGTRHKCQGIAGPVTKDDIASAATDPLALACIVDRNWGLLSDRWC